MAISPNIDDREYQCFSEVNLQTVKNVRPVLSEGESLSVDITVKGDSHFEFDSVSSVASGASILILSYIVPLAKIYHANKIFVSGTNKAKYTLKINDVIADIKRTYFTSYNATFDMTNYKLGQSSTIKIEVEHNRNTNGDFNASLFGNIQ